MLVLTRKVNEEIMVGDDVRITIVHIHGNKVRIGIDAPTDMAVDRREIRERKDQERDGDEPA